MSAPAATAAQFAAWLAPFALIPLHLLQLAQKVGFAGVMAALFIARVQAQAPSRAQYCVLGVAEAFSQTVSAVLLAKGLATALRARAAPSQWAATAMSVASVAIVFNGLRQRCGCEGGRAAAADACPPAAAFATLLPPLAGGNAAAAAAAGALTRNYARACAATCAAASVLPLPRPAL